MKPEKARVSDVPQMHKLINSFADKGEMLARSLSEIYENIRDYFVVRQGERVIACGALHISWSDLAEIKSLVVTEDSQRKGIGDQLIKVCLREAKELGIPTIFCLTYKPAFFEKFGFSQVDKAELPRKVWGECYRCPKFPNCDEVALIYHLKTGA
ncbi:Amino-acid acetyltransferase [subsurface metagenome]|uniref:N-acetyltransferase domain-containing protein n=1 Tax=marine sediment metagenome TaxID=412755 RepID=X1Q1Q5_9ZZZZ